MDRDTLSETGHWVKMSLKPGKVSLSCPNIPRVSRSTPVDGIIRYAYLMMRWDDWNCENRLWRLPRCLGQCHRCLAHCGFKLCRYAHLMTSARHDQRQAVNFASF